MDRAHLTILIRHCYFHHCWPTLTLDADGYDEDDDDDGCAGGCDGAD